MKVVKILLNLFIIVIAFLFGVQIGIRDGVNSSLNIEKIMNNNAFFHKKSKILNSKNESNIEIIIDKPEKDVKKIEEIKEETTKDNIEETTKVEGNITEEEEQKNDDINAVIDINTNETKSTDAEQNQTQNNTDNNAAEQKIEDENKVVEASVNNADPTVENAKPIEEKTTENQKIVPEVKIENNATEPTTEEKKKIKIEDIDLNDIDKINIDDIDMEGIDLDKINIEDIE